MGNFSSEHQSATSFPHIEPQSRCGHTWGNPHMWSHVWPVATPVNGTTHVDTYNIYCVLMFGGLICGNMCVHMCEHTQCVLMCEQIIRCGHICGDIFTGVATPVKRRKIVQNLVCFVFMLKFV